jgi:hypothetical protein
VIRRLVGLVAVVGVVSAGANCGDTTYDDARLRGSDRPAPPSGARIAATVQISGGPIDAGDEQADAARCPYDMEVLEYICEWQSFQPAALAFVGAGGQGGSSGETCLIPIEPELVRSYNGISVYLDCELVPYILWPDEEDPVEFWQFDDPSAPEAIALSGPLCARLRQEGFEQLDVLYPCVVYPIE